MIEDQRLAFIEKRSGVQSAILFAKQTLKIYRSSVLRSSKRGFDKPHHASFSGYRKTFIQSYLAFKKYVGKHLISL